MKKSIGLSALVAVVISLFTLGIGYYFLKDKKITVEHVSVPQQTVFTKNSTGRLANLDFTAVCEEVLDAVVYIESSYLVNESGRDYRQLPDPFRDFFEGDPFYEFFQIPKPDQRRNESQTPQRRVGSGSGVIINADGYVVTNNHVIVGADEIQVTLHDNRNYKATIIGTDPA
ncbi:MAG: trypsin-like peptidase domain-containing protein, partial [Bacteroidia bacterium]|nr:trypsin-like peptidase domain-containing protein [Bacteroidia bacterium]